MKLIFSDNTIWGLVNFRQEIFKHFYEKGYEIVLVAPSDAQTQMKTHLPDYVKFVPIQLNRSGKNPLADVKYLYSLYKVYRKERPDWIFHYTIKPNIYGTLAARLLNIPNVAMLAGLGYAFSKGGLANKIARNLYRFALQFAHKVFVLNTGNRDVLLRDHIVDSEKVILLEGGEGVNTDTIQEGPSPTQDADTIFLMVARVLYDKGYSEFVDAAKILKQKKVKARFVLLGPVDESYPNAVSQQQIDNDVAKGYIEYLGFSKTPQKIMEKPNTVVVLPSAYHEGLNRSLMEACALGKPIITTDIPGCRELVKNGINGYEIPIHNSEKLAQAMDNYLRLSLEEKIKMGHEGRKWAVERFDVKHVVRVYESIINK